ncbi:MAG: shikimate dehydrogenase [Desulfobacterales bacterium]|nr:shikimate dehydrogenase [Desulfobacterales bacterium]
MSINAETAVYAVLGDPVTHSLSPCMHNCGFAHIGYNGVYVAFRVKSIEQAITAIRALGIRGASITIPHKVGAVDFLDELDETALQIGAVNTITNRNGILKGYNTDGLGAVKALSEKTEIKGRQVAIIGAGGAARAIGFSIISQGGRATIYNRSKDRGVKLAKTIGAEFCPFSELKTLNCSILINTTPLGMIPHTDIMPVRKENLTRDMVVMDIVYNPLHTCLLKTAEDIGCRTIDGVAMFVYQGACQFELWTGQKAPITVMKEAVQSALKNKG